MEVNKKSIHHYIMLLVFQIALLLSGLMLVSILFFNYLLSSGVILPANYVEKMAIEITPVIKTAPEITPEIIPEELKFGIYHKEEIRFLYGDLSDKEIKQGKRAIENGGRQITRGTVYLAIERESEVCVIKYQLTPIFKNIILRRIIPYPEIMFILIFILIFILGLYWLTKRLSNKLRKEIDKFYFIASKIREQDLEFESVETDVLEFQDVFHTLDNLKIALRKSLLQQFQQERRKQEQISGLAHDIKIPLTIIRGSGELIKLNKGDGISQYKEYAIDILEAAKEIDEYIMLLISVSKDEINLDLNIKKAPVVNFIKGIIDYGKGSLEKKGISFQPQIEIGEEVFWEIDQEQLTRALINVLLNGIEHTEDAIIFEASLISDFVHLSIIDNGGGFSEEALEKAKNLFYTGDKSRSKVGHYGIGLAFAENVVKAHGGQLILKNREGMKGAKVILKIPLRG